jgi:TonB family protein
MIIRLLLLALLGAATLAIADPPPAGVEKRTSAVATTRKPPQYPRDELATGREGWVILSYVVQVDGTVRDVIVQDSSGLDAFERAAAKAARNWIFKPATVDGVPVEDAVVRTKIHFRLDPPARGAREPFVRSFRAAMRAMEAGKLDEAGAVIERMEQRPFFNLYEDAFYWMLKYSWYRARGQAEAEFTSLRRAVAYEGAYLPDKLHVQALSNLFVLEVKRSSFAEALAVHARLQKSKDSAEALAAMAEPVAQIHALIDGPQSFAREGRIDRDGQSWTHRLARKQFTIDQVKGQIGPVEVLCEHQVGRLEWAADRSWSLPASWGECDATVQGSTGTSFRLVELPAAAAAPAPG